MFNKKYNEALNKLKEEREILESQGLMNVSNIIQQFIY